MSNSDESGKTPDSGRSGVGKCAVTCPMCGFEHTQYRLNPRMYWNTELDVDRKPTKFQCLKGIDGCFPPLYELWHCPRCHFTSHNRTFPEPLKNVFIEKGLIQRRFSEAVSSDSPFGRVCKALGEGLVPENIDFPNAVRLALLAIFVETFVSDLLRQGRASLARSYLRLAWLYRDWKDIEPDFARSFAELDLLLGRVSVDWPSICRTEESALDQARFQYAEALKEATVVNDPKETTGILLHTARICMQVKQYEAARENLTLCISASMEERNRLVHELREDDRLKALSEEDRARKLSDSRRFDSTIDDCQALQAEVRTFLQRLQPVAPPPRQGEAKKGLLRGLFGG